MSRYEDYRSSAGSFDTRDRYERRQSRGPAVMERPRHVEDERFEFRMHEEDRYGPPARAPGRHYEDEHLVRSSGPLVAHDRRRRRDESPSFAPPRLVRRQSSLDTFDRIPRRRMETLEVSDRPRGASRASRAPRAPHVPHPPRFSPGRYREREVYEDIRIAEPDLYGDEEFREFRERTSMGHHRRRSSSGTRSRREEKPYPRKGKTRIPRKWVHVHAILDLGYPFKEDGEVIVIQKALSKEQIDEVISLSKEFRRPAEHVETEYLRVSRSPVRAIPRERVTTEHLAVDSRHRDTHYIEASPRRHGYEEIDYEEYTPRARTLLVSRPRSVSVNTQARPSTSLQLIEPRTYAEERIETRPRNSGQMVLVRPRDSDREVDQYVRELEEEARMLRLERRGGYEVTRDRETDVIDNKGNEMEIHEVRRTERKEPSAGVMRAMLATLT